jgi:hypothetical protein
MAGLAAHQGGHVEHLFGDMAETFPLGQVDYCLLPDDYSGAVFRYPLSDRSARPVWMPAPPKAARKDTT